MKLLWGILLAILSIGAAVAAVYIAKITINWVRDKIRERRNKQTSGSKTLFVETKNLFDEPLKRKMAKAHGIKMSDIDKMCEEHPYLIADYDGQSDTVSGHETFRAGKIDSATTQLLRDNDGLVIVDG